MRLRTLAGCLCWAVLGAATQAHAQTADSSAAAPAPLSLELHLADSQLDPEAIRRAVELELKRPVELVAPGAPSLAETSGQRLSVVARSNHTVTVSYRTAGGPTRTRSIGVPQDPARGAEVIALLSGNLSRDEAAELLAALTAKAHPADAAPSATKAEPEPADALAPKPPAAAQADVAKTDATAAAPPPPRTPATQPDPWLSTRFPFNLSLFAPIAIYPDAARRKLTLELGLAFSHVGALHGLGMNVFALHTEGELRGLTLATLYNRTGGSAKGVTVSAIVNRSERFDGAQISGIVNVGSGEAQGLSLAGVANVRSGAVEGLQIAGVVNRAETMRGLQLAGVVNVASELNGLQIGVVNVAGNVHGAQIGVVNIAKHVDGTSIGLVSVADNARLQPVIWASTLMPLDLAMKFTLGPLYSQLGGGYSPGNDTYTYELGLGGHFPIGRFFLEPGIHYSEMRSARHPGDHELLEHAHYRLAGGLDAGWFSPFLGVALLQRFAHSADAPNSTPLTVEGFAGVALGGS